MTAPVFSIPTITVTPQAAIDAYRNADQGSDALGSATAGSDPTSFGSALQRAMEGAVDLGHDADAKSMQAIAGGGNITDVVTAVSKANLALQSTVAIRDRMVQAYQDIIKMPI
jgi:flagellar hook-basal body complex protein FliE